MATTSYLKGHFGGVGKHWSWDPKDKQLNIDQNVGYMLARTQSMFEYEGLPDTIPQRDLELMLQTNGNVCIAEYEGKLYAFTGGAGGEPNPYYLPTLYVVANPALKMSKTYTIGEDCVLLASDSLFIGLMPMFAKYATQLAENELSMHIVDIMARVISLISASDDRTKKAADKFIKDIIKGEFGVIAESAFLDGIRSQPISGANNNYLVPLIEYQQYIKASWLNDIGLNANFNMKREALNSSESSLNQDALLPLVDDMLRCRQRGVEAVNAMFGTNISVKLASSWEDNQQEVDNSLELEDLPEKNEVVEEEISTEEQELSVEEKVEEAVELLEEVEEEVSEEEEVTDYDPGDNPEVE